MDPDQTAPLGVVCSGSTMFASILNLSVMLGNYLQQRTLADGIFGCNFFLALYGLTQSAVNTGNFIGKWPVNNNQTQN